MVPKPNPGEWRFTLDFVRLNACTDELEGWPITLIRPLFQRLGARKPLFFGVMDLTSGYHQAPWMQGPKPIRRLLRFLVYSNGLEYQWGLRDLALTSSE